MHLTLALLASLGAAGLLIALTLTLGRAAFLVRQLTFPLYVAAAAAGLYVFTLFPAGRSAQAAGALGWLLLFLVCAVVLRLLGLFLFDVHLQSRKGVRLPPLLPAVAMLVVYLLAALITLRVSFPQLDVAPLLATSAVTSLVLGLALQPILGNFFAGIVISLEKPFRLNDWIKVGEHDGRVVAINWRTTHLRTRDNDNVVIPNGRIADDRILNYYYPHPMHLEKVRVGIHYDTPPYRARRALLECAPGVAGILDKPTAEVYVVSFDDSAVVYELRVWIEDVAQSTRIASDLRARIWEELKRSGIAIPYPTRTLEIARRERSAGAAGTARAAGKAATGGPVSPAGPAWPARLFVAEGAERGRTLELDEGPVTIGRSRSSTLALADVNASKEHLRIEWTPEGYVLTDLGSSFGTRVNGQAASRVLLSPLDRIAIGDTLLVFESESHAR
ncbi:MAG TPA: mechanosensitive ion channel domain-containing protein [Thermoanaerobaculia bacterium]|nr:mechanosensitive ion channel domain-containing protein [Thermoanaerobaculia bacterium]